MAYIPKLHFRRGDLIAVAAVILLAAATILLFLPKAPVESAVVQIYQDGKLIHEVSTDTPTTLSIEGAYHNTVVIENGQVSITESTCPGGDCVHSGQISQPGRSIVCLPNRVEIRIVGTADIDFVVR